MASSTALSHSLIVNPHSSFTKPTLTPSPTFPFKLTPISLSSSPLKPPPFVTHASSHDEISIEKRFPAFPTVMDINKIREILPHRFSFLLVDRVVEYTPRVSAVAIKNVTIFFTFFFDLGI